MAEPSIPDEAVHAFDGAYTLANVQAGRSKPPVTGWPRESAAIRAGLVAAYPHLAQSLADEVVRERLGVSELGIAERLSTVVAEGTAREIEEANPGGDCGFVYERCAEIARELGRRAARPAGSSREESRVVDLANLLNDSEWRDSAEGIAFMAGRASRDAEVQRLYDRIHEAVDECQRRHAVYVSRCAKHERWSAWARQRFEEQGSRYWDMTSEADRLVIMSIIADRDAALAKLAEITGGSSGEESPGG